MSLPDWVTRLARRSSNLLRSHPLLLILVAVLCLVAGSVVILQSCAGKPPEKGSSGSGSGSRSGTVLPAVQARSAILIEALQISCHLVECSGDRRQFFRAVVE